MTTITIEQSLLEQALNALLLPCDRWNKQQFLIVKGAIESLNAALVAPATAQAAEIERLKTESEERLQNCAALIAENERLRKDAERYRFIRDADRSDCIWREICIYAMETLDEYVDAAMDGEATMKGTP